MAERCDLCRHDALEPAYAPERSGRGLSVHLCTHCGLVQSLPRADRAARAPAAVSGGADWGNVRYGKGFRTKVCMDLIGAHADLSSALSVLDVGSNRGSFAHAFAAAAPNARITCVEPDERVAASVVGVAGAEIVHARIEDTNFADESFDIVHSCHTIEHLASPTAVLADHWRTLKPGGLLLIDAPNIALIGGDDILEEWFIDKHLYHYSPVTLGRALDAAGFDIIDGPSPMDRENLTFAALKRAVANRPVAHDPGEALRATALIHAYATARAENLIALTAVASELRQLAPRRVAIWGAGRLFDALVTHGGFDPRALTLLIDAHLKAHVAERHGVALSAPEALKDTPPGIIVVMSRAFAGEIAKQAREYAPKAEIILYGDLLARARMAFAA